jgi:hypothetical protein
VISHQVRNQRGRVTRKKPVEELTEHRRSHHLLADGCPVNEMPALNAVGDHALVFHFTKHGGDGCGRKAAVCVQRLVHPGYRGLAALPQLLHDRVLKFSECVLAHPGLLFVPTTKVILPR